jgi:hypothetical protein
VVPFLIRFTINVGKTIYAAKKDANLHLKEKRETGSQKMDKTKKRITGTVS